MSNYVPKRLLEFIFNGEYVKFYQSREWRQKRKEILKRDNNECQRCKSEGKYHVAEHVHHIKHLDKYPFLALTNSNLISLCKRCHNKEHPEKLEKYKKVKPKIDIPERW